MRGNEQINACYHTSVVCFVTSVQKDELLRDKSDKKRKLSNGRKVTMILK